MGSGIRHCLRLWGLSLALGMTPLTLSSLGMLPGSALAASNPCASGGATGIGGTGLLPLESGMGGTSAPGLVRGAEGGDDG